MQMQRQRRMIITFLGISICLLALLGRLGYIQLYQGEELSRMALARDAKIVALEDIPRGDILDRNGKPLTGAYMANRIVIFPSAVEDVHKAAVELARVLNVNPSNLIPYFEGPPCYLPYDLTTEQVQRIRQNSEPGINVLPVKFRYGSDPLAPHITGHLGKISSLETYKFLNNAGEKYYNYGDWIGVMGLEKYYEYQLKGNYPTRQAYMLMDARERLISKNRVRVDKNPIDPGRYNIVTTIDLRVQQVVERILDRRVEKGAVVVMKPHSGDILACASRPDFNPEPSKISLAGNEKGMFVNRAMALFQPGSLFKVVLACAALEEGLAEPETNFYCRGAEDRPVRCWYSPGHGKLTLYEAMVNSCNPTFVQLGQQLGAKKIIEYARKLGLENNRIIGFPEVAGNRQNFQAIAGPYNLANSSIGQGPVLATPVQLTAMMNIIASEGFYYQPRIAKEFLAADGKKIEFPNPPGKRVVSAQTVNILRHMLKGVTREGVGQKAFVQSYGSSGKTGSAQVRDSSGESINAWFSGYVPSNNPRYVITVLVQGGKSGGETAAPIFQEIAGELMKL